MNILVTFRPNELQRRTLQNSLVEANRLEFLSDAADDTRDGMLTEAEVLISWNLAAELKHPEWGMIAKAKFLQLLSAGVDQVQFSKIARTTMVAGNAGAYADQMAEHILAMILAVYKSLLDRHAKLVNGIFDQENENRLLSGSDCTILGFGGIGKATARLLHCFGARVFAVNTTGRTNEKVEFIGTLDDLEYVLRTADIIVVSLPLTNSTRGLINRRELGWMKENATIINVARGAIIDEAALFDKLKANQKFTAAIDAWWVEPEGGRKFETEYPFLTLPNVLGSPHNSGLTPNSFVTAVAAAAENVNRFINQRPVAGLVNRRDYL